MLNWHVKTLLILKTLLKSPVSTFPSYCIQIGTNKLGSTSSRNKFAYLKMYSFISDSDMWSPFATLRFLRHLPPPPTFQPNETDSLLICLITLFLTPPFNHHTQLTNTIQWWKSEGLPVVASTTAAGSPPPSPSCRPTRPSSSSSGWSSSSPSFTGSWTPRPPPRPLSSFSGGHFHFRGSSQCSDLWCIIWQALEELGMGWR